MIENIEAVRCDWDPCGDLPPEEQVLGVSAAMEKARQAVEKISRTNVPVLIQGEGGTGKEILARIIHRRYPGEALPFLEVASQEFRHSPYQLPSSVLAALPETPEFQSHIEGSPCEGTVCFSEVGELCAGSQWKLMQMLRGDPPLAFGLAGRKGSGFRVICTTSKALENEVQAGRFRQDVFYCINAVNVHMPPLRERREDIPSLAHYFWESYTREFDCPASEPSSRMIGFLQERPWRGNLRELANVMKRYVLLGSEEAVIMELTESAVAHPVPGPPAAAAISLKTMVREAARTLERKVILKTLQENQWNRRRAARALNISYRALLYKVKEAGLPRKQACLSRAGFDLGSSLIALGASKEGAN